MEAMFGRWHKSLFRREFNLCKNRRTVHSLQRLPEGRARIAARRSGAPCRINSNFQDVLDSMAGVKLASGACPARSRKARFLTDLLPHLRWYRRRPNRRRQFEENFLQPPGKLSWSQPRCSQALPTLRDSG